MPASGTHGTGAASAESPVNPGLAAAILRGGAVLFRAIGGRHGEGGTLVLEGEACLAAGDPAAVRRCWEAGVEALAETDPAGAERTRERLRGLPGVD